MRLTSVATSINLHVQVETFPLFILREENAKLRPYIWYGPNMDEDDQTELFVFNSGRTDWPAPMVYVGELVQEGDYGFWYLKTND